MAVKKKTSKMDEATAAPTTAAAPKGVKKKAAPKKAAAPAPAAAETSSKAGTPKAAAPKAAPKGAAMPKAKKAAPAAIKLTGTQHDLLKKIGEATGHGYLSGKKIELKTLQALQDRKLIKRGAKDKASGGFHYQVSTAGKKHMDSSPPA